MFALKARVTAFVCVLIICINISLLYLPVEAPVRALLCAALVLASGVPGYMRRSAWCAGACVVVTCGAWWHFANWIAESEKYSPLRLASEHAPVSFVGTICDTSTSASGAHKHFVIEIGAFGNPFGSQCRGKLIMTGSPAVSAARGDIVVARGVIEKPEPPIHPWDYSILPLLRKTGAVASVRTFAFTVVPVRGRRDLQSMVDDVRARIIQTHINAIGRAQGNLLTSMVIGNRNVEVDGSIAEAFRNLGIAHTLAASGFNVSVVVGSTWWLLRPFISNSVVLNSVAGLLMAFYSALAGLSASIVRAGIMCAGLLIAGAFGRRTDILAALGGTLALTLILDPRCLADVGLQLSYISTLTLMCKAGSVRGKYYYLPALHPMRFVLDAAIPCAMAVASLFPLQLYYFWQTGLLQVPANVVISPVVPIITLEGFASSAAACLHWIPLSQVLDRIASLLVMVMMMFVNWLNSFEWSVVNTGPPALWKVLAYYVFVGIALASKTFSRRSLVAVCGMFLCAILLMWRERLPPLTVVHMYRAGIAIDADRNAIVLGDADLYQVRKCLAFFAARADTVKRHPVGETAGMSWELERQNRLLVRIRGTERIVRVRATRIAKVSGIAVYE